MVLSAVGLLVLCVCTLNCRLDCGLSSNKHKVPSILDPFDCISFGAWAATAVVGKCALKLYFISSFNFLPRLFNLAQTIFFI